MISEPTSERDSNVIETSRRLGVTIWHEADSLLQSLASGGFVKIVKALKPISDAGCAHQFVLRVVCRVTDPGSSRREMNFEPVGVVRAAVRGACSAVIVTAVSNSLELGLPWPLTSTL